MSILVGSAYGTVGLDTSDFVAGVRQVRLLNRQLQQELAQPIMAGGGGAAGGGAGGGGAAPPPSMHLVQQSTQLKQVLGQQQEATRNAVGLGQIISGNVIADVITRGTMALVGYTQQATHAYASNERLGLSLTALIAREEVSARRVQNLSDAMGEAGPKAERLLGWTQKLAVDSPFSQEGVASAFRMATSFGFVAESADKGVVSAQRLTTALINFSSATGQDESTMQRISLALGQTLAKGRLQGEELLQLTEAGLNARDILSKAFGVSTEALTRMQEKGLIPANRAIRAIVESLEKDFGGAAIAQANTISGLTNSLSDLQLIGQRELFGGVIEGVKPFLVEVVGKLSDPATQLQLRNFGKDFGAGFQAAIPPLIGLVTSIYGAIQPLIPLGLQIVSIIRDNLGPILLAFGATKLVPLIATVGTFVTGLKVLATSIIGVSGAAAAVGAAGAAGAGVAAAAVPAAIATSAAGRLSQALNGNAAITGLAIGAATIAIASAIITYQKLQEQVGTGNRAIEEQLLAGSPDFGTYQRQVDQVRATADADIFAKMAGAGQIQALTEAQFRFARQLTEREEAPVAPAEALAQAQTAGSIFARLEEARQGQRVEQTGRNFREMRPTENQFTTEQYTKAEEDIQAILQVAPQVAPALAQMTTAFADNRLSAESYSRALQILRGDLVSAAAATEQTAASQAQQEQRNSDATRIIRENLEARKNAEQAVGIAGLAATEQSRMQQGAQQRLAETARELVQTTGDLDLATIALAARFGITETAARSYLTAMQDANTATRGLELAAADRERTQALAVGQLAQRAVKESEFSRTVGQYGAESPEAFRAETQIMQQDQQRARATRDAREQAQMARAATEAGRLGVQRGRLARIGSEDGADSAEYIQLAAQISTSERQLSQAKGDAQRERAKIGKRGLNAEIGFARDEVAVARSRFGSSSTEAYRAETQLLSAQERRADTIRQGNRRIEDIQRESYRRLTEMQEDFALSQSRSEEDFQRQQTRLLAEGRVKEAKLAEDEFRLRQTRQQEDYARQTQRQEIQTDDQQRDARSSLQEQLTGRPLPRETPGALRAQDTPAQVEQATRNQAERLRAEGKFKEADRLLADAEREAARKRDDATTKRDRGLTNFAEEEATRMKYAPGGGGDSRAPLAEAQRAATGNAARDRRASALSGVPAASGGGVVPLVRIAIQPTAVQINGSTIVDITWPEVETRVDEALFAALVQAGIATPPQGGQQAGLG